MAKATAYLIIEATRGYGLRDPETGLRPVTSARVVASRANRPAKLERDQVAVKVTVDVPDQAFAPIMPAALVVVPDDLIQRSVEVEAHNAGEADND